VVGISISISATVLHWQDEHEQRGVTRCDESSINMALIATIIAVHSSLAAGSHHSASTTSVESSGLLAKHSSADYSEDGSRLMWSARYCKRSIPAPGDADLLLVPRSGTEQQFMDEATARHAGKLHGMILSLRTSADPAHIRGGTIASRP